MSKRNNGQMIIFLQFDGLITLEYKIQLEQCVCKVEDIAVGDNILVKVETLPFVNC